LRIKYGYTISEFEEYDKDGFPNKEKALRSAKATVRNLQRSPRADHLRLDDITLTTNAIKSSVIYNELKEYERVEIR
jgi:hypothetical protein